MHNRLSPMLLRWANVLLIAGLLSGCGSENGKEQVENARPQVTIAGDTVVVEKQTISLTANATDSDGQISSYKWTQTAGPDISVGSDNQSTLSFQSPDISVDTSVTFSVTVTDNDGLTAVSAITFSIERISDSIAISAIVTDEPLPEASVELIVGDESFTTTTDTEGKYTLNVEIDERNFDELILLVALGNNNTHPNVKLVSQLASIQTLKAATGEDGILEASEYFAVNVTNVSTAKVVLLEKANGNQALTSEQQLQQLSEQINQAELYEMAAALKILIDDDNFALPDGVADTLALLKDETQLTAFIALIEASDSNLLLNYLQQILLAPELVGATAAADNDFDDDGVQNSVDAFPVDGTESVDTDNDNIGNNADTDDDNDDVLDENDAFPLDASESIDTDTDGLGNNADTDDDNDDVLDENDAFPLDASESIDTDSDGLGNNADTDDDNDDVLDENDAFPLDASESIDSDSDGLGNNADTDDDNDDVLDENDAFPLDAAESIDTDLDGVGNNADTDDDNDSVLDEQDAYPTISLGGLTDTDGDGIPDDCDDSCQNLGMVADDDDNGNGIPDDEENISLSVLIDTPVSLVTVGTSPVRVSGIATAGATLFLNGVEIDNTDGTFEGDVSLQEGSNSIEARAILDDSIQTDLITISLDKTPPYLTVDSHQNNQTIYEPVITVTGLVNDIVRGTIEATQANVMVNGTTAIIQNRSYSVSDVELSQGPNTITVEGSDQVGNTASISFVINYQLPLGKKVTVVSGQQQQGSINTELAEPISIRVVDQDNNPLPGESVVFRVSQGSGVVAAGSQNEGRAVAVDTDADGIANTRFKLGSRSGVNNQKVSASVVGIEGKMTFTASAQGQVGNKLSVNSGNNQRGVVNNNLPEAFVTIVTDSGANVVQGARVKFTESVGDGTFSNGQSEITVETDSDGRATVQFRLGSKTGFDSQRVLATLLDSVNNESITAGFSASAFVLVKGGDTSISGVVLDNQDQPIQNVTVRIEDSTREALTDENGQFTIAQAPVGPVHLIADGSTVTDGGEYPSLSYNLVTISGIENPMPAPIYMVKLDTENAVFAGPESVTLEMPSYPGFKLEIAKDSVTFPDGTKEGLVSVTAVNASKVPMAPPNGMQPQFIVTIQPTGTRFDPPARLSLPNVDAHPSGAQVEMYSYDHDLEEFVSIGLGTASEDASVIQSNPGVGVIKAGWHCGSQPQGTGCCGGGGDGGGGCPTCKKRSGTSCEDGDCVPDNSQDPGDCKKCSGGFAISDNSEQPTGKDGPCLKCEGGAPAPDSTKNDNKCGATENQSCFTCKDGKCDNHCTADPAKRKLAITSGDLSGLNQVVKKLEKLGDLLPGPFTVVSASAVLSLNGSIESGEKCCGNCSPGKPLKSSYNKYQGDFKIESAVKLGIKGSKKDINKIIPFTSTRVVLAYEIGPFLEVKGELGNAFSYETSDCEEGNCVTFGVNGKLGTQLSLGGKVEIKYDQFERSKCPFKSPEVEAQNENTTCFGSSTGTAGEIWGTGGSAVTADIAVSECPNGDKCQVGIEKVAGKIFYKATIAIGPLAYEYEDVLEERTFFEGGSASCL